MIKSKAQNLLYYLREIGEVVDERTHSNKFMVSKVEPYWFTVESEVVRDGSVLLSVILPMYGGNGPKGYEMFVDATRCALANVIAKKNHVKYFNPGYSYHRFELHDATEDNSLNLTQAVREWQLLNTDSRVKKIASETEVSLENLLNKFVLSLKL